MWQLCNQSYDPNVLLCKQIFLFQDWLYKLFIGFFCSGVYFICLLIHYNSCYFSYYIICVTVWECVRQDRQEKGKRGDNRWKYNKRTKEMRTVSPTAASVRKEKHTAPEMKVCVCEERERDRVRDSACVFVMKCTWKRRWESTITAPRSQRQTEISTQPRPEALILLTNPRPPCPLSPPGVW